MKLLSKTITFDEKALQEELTKINRRLDALEHFYDDVLDVMDFMPHDEHYESLNAALTDLNKRSRDG